MSRSKSYSSSVSYDDKVVVDDSYLTSKILTQKEVISDDDIQNLYIEVYDLFSDIFKINIDILYDDIAIVISKSIYTQNIKKIRINNTHIRTFLTNIESIKDKYKTIIRNFNLTSIRNEMRKIFILLTNFMNKVHKGTYIIKEDIGIPNIDKGLNSKASYNRILTYILYKYHNKIYIDEKEYRDNIYYDLLHLLSKILVDILKVRLGDIYREIMEKYNRQNKDEKKRKILLGLMKEKEAIKEQLEGIDREIAIKKTKYELLSTKLLSYQ